MVSLGVRGPWHNAAAVCCAGWAAGLRLVAGVWGGKQRCEGGLYGGMGTGGACVCGLIMDRWMWRENEYLSTLYSKASVLPRVTTPARRSVPLSRARANL